MRGLAGKVDMVIDGGKTEIGIESTVVDLTVEPLKMVRQGAIKEEELFKVING
jgi:L-threonylcarbamoyladenylate synthase